MSSNLSTTNSSMESRLIYSSSDHYPSHTYGILNRKGYLTEEIDLENQEYFEPEIESHYDKPRNPYHRDEPRQNYDPWRDIYLKGNWDPKVSSTNMERQKSDRKSVNYVDYDEYEYEEEEDEDQAFIRRPQKKKNRRRKRPLKEHRPRQKPRPTSAYEYEDPDSYENSIVPKDKGSSHPDQQQQSPSLTRRVTDVLTPFSGGILTVIAVLAVPFLIAAGYWLLVVNGPTPVVKARIDDPDFDGQVSFEEENFSKYFKLKTHF
jgi:hypothetical protein